MRPSLCVLLLLTGCMAADNLSADDYMEEDFPPWTCDTEGTTTGCDSTGDLTAPQCEGAQDCPGEVCAASFNGDIGPFECQSQCIDAMDDNRWCLDSDACCDPTAVCDRGYCVPTDGGSSTTDVATTGAGESSGADTTDGGSSTDGGTTDSTGTSA